MLTENQRNRIGSMLDESKSDRSQIERFWDRSIMFTRGDQWFHYGRQGDIVRPRVREGDRITRYTANMLLNLYRSMLARLSLAYPSVAVLPASDSNDDIIAAQCSEWALQYFWQKANLKKRFEKAEQWMLETGNAFIHTCWNADPNVNDVQVDTVSPYDGYFQKDVSDPDDSEWVALRSFPTRAEAKAKFPNDDRFPEREKIIDESPAAETSRRRSSNRRLNTIPSDRIELWEIYWRTGEHVIYTGKKIIWEPAPEERDRSERSVREFFPVAFVRYTEIPGLVHGVGLIEPLQDIQYLYNKARTQVLANVELMANPKILIARSAAVKKQRFTNRPGEVVRWSGIGPEPKQWVPSPLPGYLLDHIARMQAELGDAAGVHSTSLGKRAVGISSGKAIEAITERDIGHLHITQANVEQAVKQTAETILHLMQQHYTQARLIRMMDNQGEVIFKHLKGTDLSRTPEVFIEAGSLFRNEAKDRDQRLLDLLQLGVIDQKTFREESSFRTSNGFVSRRIANMSHAQDLLEAMKRGHEIEIFYTDDLDAFQRIFDAFVKTEEFYGLPPETQTNIRNMLVRIMLAMMQPPPDPAMLAGQIQQLPSKPGEPGAPGLLPGAQELAGQPGAQVQAQNLATQSGESGGVGGLGRL